MYTFLTKLAQLDAINDVFLLSEGGEVLCAMPAEASVKIAGGIARWREVVDGLAGAPSADFFFEKGCFYVHNVHIGHVIVSMKEARSLERVKMACTQVEKKLVEPLVRKKVLLKMMAEVDEACKPHLVRELAPAAEPVDREVAGQLIALLRQVQGSPQGREELLASLCEALGHSSSPEALAALEDYMCKNKAMLPETLQTAVKVSVQQLLLELPQARVTEQEKKENVPAASAPAPGPKAISPGGKGPSNSPEHRQIEELLSSGKKSEAIAQIMAAIEAAAHNRQFERAENLRELLIQVDSMALREIIRAAEVIEQAKRVSVKPEYQEAWADLALVLASEEFSALYHAMTPQVFAKDAMVVRQGDFSSSLYFVNSGRVQLYAVSQEREIPLKSFGAGEIMGAANFFEISVWTVSARSLGAEVYVLTRKKLQRLKESHPALKAKLLEFCARFPSEKALFSRTGRSRRRFDRKKASGRASIVLLDEQGQETSVGAKGDIIDVSKGGLSFSLRFSKKETAAALLGKKIRITIRPENSNATIACNAKIMAVRCCDFIGSDYSLHVEFQQELDHSQLQQVLGKGR